MGQLRVNWFETTLNMRFVPVDGNVRTFSVPFTASWLPSQINPGPGLGVRRANEPAYTAALNNLKESPAASAVSAPLVPICKTAPWLVSVPATTTRLLDGTVAGSYRFP